MVTLRLGPEDVANLRFAISPLMELHNSVRALEHPEAKALHLPWVAATRERVRDLDMALLHALHPRGAYTPDFIDPPPRSPLGELEDELEEMLATPPERVRFELRRAYEGRALPPLLEALEDELPALADLFRAYWERALAPVLAARPRAPRGRRPLPRAAARGRRGEAAVRRHPPRGLVRRGHAADRHALRRDRRPRRPRPAVRPQRVHMAAPGGVGRAALAAVPRLPRARASAACGSRAARRRRRRSPPCSARAAPASSPRSARPRSTTELARALELSPGSVSQHLSVLRDAGLVHGHRVGRSVLYVRSEKGEALVG